MLKTPRRTVTLRDVAALAGIDKATASRALSGKGYMSPQTRDAALKAAQELGFQPDVHAQRLANGRNHNIIALFPAGDMGVSTQQAWFIEHRLDELGFEVEIHSTPRWVSHFEDKQVALVNKVRRQRPGAILFESQLSARALDELRLFIEEGGIVVNYGSLVELSCDQVLFDMKARAYQAARHLLELGHREIGFCFHGPIDNNAPEMIGFLRALEEFDVVLNEQWLFCGGNYEEGGARLAKAFLSWSKRPTALCIINDVSASVLLNVLFQRGLSVPKDVSVVGFDDVLAARYALVPLSTVTYPLEESGTRIVEFTQSRFKGYDGLPRQHTVESELIIRSSSAPPTRKSSPAGRAKTKLFTSPLWRRLRTPQLDFGSRKCLRLRLGNHYESASVSWKKSVYAY
jgi:DNA-binding LacI/PurR family transcriptional regulator